LQGGERPPWASGKIVQDYRPLYAYWRLARRRGREDLVESAMLRDEDFRELRRLVSGGSSRAVDLVEELAGILEERVDPDVAVDALREVFGVDFDRETARRRIALILAGWLVEAGEEWGILKLRIPWGEGGSTRPS